MTSLATVGEGRLHGRVTAVLARRVIEGERAGRVVEFAREAELCGELGVSRSILRESMKVLVDKGMVEMKPRAGTRSRAREGWRRLDADILCWQAEIGADERLVRELGEVRLAIEPTAAGFAAVRASGGQMAEIEECLRRREAAEGGGLRALIELDLEFQAAVVAASGNELLAHVCESIRAPLRVALRALGDAPGAARLGLEAHVELVECLKRRDPLGARRAAEQVVGLAMVAVESGLKRMSRKKKGGER